MSPTRASIIESLGDKKSKQEETYSEFKASMIDRFGVDAWEVIENFCFNGLEK